MNEAKSAGTQEAGKVVAERTNPALLKNRVEQQKPADTRGFFQKEATRVEHTEAEEKKAAEYLKRCYQLGYATSTGHATRGDDARESVLTIQPDPINEAVVVNLRVTQDVGKDGKPVVDDSFHLDRLREMREKGEATSVLLFNLTLDTKHLGDYGLPESMNPSNPRSTYEDRVKFEERMRKCNDFNGVALDEGVPPEDLTAVYEAVVASNYKEGDGRHDQAKLAKSLKRVNGGERLTKAKTQLESILHPESI